MQNCGCGFRSTPQTFVKDGSIHCAECGSPVPLELALYTGHDLLPALEPSPAARLARLTPSPEERDLLDSRWQSRVRAKSGRLADNWFGARPWR